MANQNHGARNLLRKNVENIKIYDVRHFKTFFDKMLTTWEIISFQIYIKANISLSKRIISKQRFTEI